MSVKPVARKKKNILFVCCGNRERSLIAENLLVRRLEDETPRLSEKVDISSAGIFPKVYLERAQKVGVTFVAPYFGKSPNISRQKLRLRYGSSRNLSLALIARIRISATL